MTLLLLLAACSTPEPVTGPDPEAAAEVADILCTLFRKIEQDCTRDGARLSAGGHAIEVSAEVTKEVAVGTEVALDLRYALTVDGAAAPALSTVMVASGRGREGAREKAANDWGSVYGAAIIDRLVNDGKLGVLQALVDDQDPPPAFETQGWIAYPGWLHLTGKLKERRPLDIQGLLDAVAPITASWAKEPGATHAMLVHVTMREGYAPEGACQLDGQPSPELCALALKAPWPEPGPSFIAKQYFVFTPGSLAPTDPPATPGPAEATPEAMSASPPVGGP